MVVEFSDIGIKVLSHHLCQGMGTHPRWRPTAFGVTDTAKTAFVLRHDERLSAHLLHLQVAFRIPGARHQFAPSMTMKQLIDCTTHSTVCPTHCSKARQMCSTVATSLRSAWVKNGVRHSCSSSRVRYCLRRPPSLGVSIATTPGRL